MLFVLMSLRRPQKRLDLLLRAKDLLADIIIVSRDGGQKVDADGMISQLEQDFNLAPIVEAAEEIDYAAVPISILDMDLGQSDGLNQYNISFIPTIELYLCGHDPKQTLRELLLLGECTIQCNSDNVPSLENFDFNATDLSWSIELKTDKSEDEIEAVFEWVEPYCELSIENTKLASMLLETNLDDVFASFDGEGAADPFGESMTLDE